MNPFTHPQDADGLFAAAKAIGEKVAAERAARRERQRQERNARRRAHYRSTPRKPKPPPMEAEPELDEDTIRAQGCQCGTMSNPPCMWCTDYRTED